VVLKKQGRREVASDFEMPEGRDLSLRLELSGSEGSNAPRLVVSSKPDGATVSIDGAAVGQTPWAGTVNPGPRALSVALAGFVSEQRKVDAKPNREMEVSFALQRVPGPAKVVVETEPTGADLSVDGEASGKSPATLELAPGEHEIEASRAGFKGVAQKITVEKGQHASLRLALAAAAGKRESIIAVATDPKGARLYVDNKLVGETPFKVKSSPGQHDIRVALDGFITRSAKIKLPENKDFELRVAVSLKRVRGEEQAAARDPREIARAQLKSAVNCDKQGDWDCALKNFQAAYDFEQKPEILFNIGQIRRKKGDFQEAANAYRAYIRAKPDGQLSKRAQQFAERCEAVVKGGEKNVAEDDTEPPVIKHTAIAKALRGHPVKLEAVITDNQSGVFNPQACWRTVYNTEYECAPLALIGQDTYAVEVPAKVVTDGFAYFLEAFDNATNGPARSGAPEVPHSVAVEEPTPLPEVPAPAAETKPVAETPAAAGAVQAKAVEGQGAAAQPASAQAAVDAHGAAQTPAAAGTAGAQPAGQLAAQTPQDLLGRPLERSPGQTSAWYLLVHLGAERAVERYTDSVVDGRVGIELSRRIESNMLALVAVDARTVRQPYRAQAPAPGQPAPTLGLDEQRYGVRAAYGFDFGSLIMPADKDRLSLALLGAVEYQRWQNQVFPANYLGLGGYLQGRYAVYEPFAIVLSGGYTWNVVSNDTDSTGGTSAVGTPRSDLVVRAGVEFTITSRFALELTYRGDLLALQNDYRFTNGVSFGFGTGF
jgi:hypothetical protein